VSRLVESKEEWVKCGHASQYRPTVEKTVQFPLNGQVVIVASNLDWGEILLQAHATVPSHSGELSALYPLPTSVGSFNNDGPAMEL
jgi:hypothetical protein